MTMLRGTSFMFSHGKNRRPPKRPGAGAVTRIATPKTGYALCRAKHGPGCSCEAQGMTPCVDAAKALVNG